MSIKELSRVKTVAALPELMTQSKAKAVGIAYLKRWIAETEAYSPGALDEFPASANQFDYKLLTKALKKQIINDGSREAKRVAQIGLAALGYLIMSRTDAYILF